ncbi:ComEC/Rec2 family competence protein [Ponticaulis sp.]|uniref:ComEC/Rec2 family competence protein n=1 Tax=Ponticaulis sp. TaxID=2020902 RepID=UPI0025F365A4|nr:ComEC/Rec2 family competence protein [Ponticaulis sp.]
MKKLLLLKSETSQGYFQRMLWVPVAFAAGCAAYFAGDQEPGWFAYACALTALVAGGLMAMRVASSLRALPEFALILMAFAIFGFCYSAFRTYTMPYRGIPAPFERVMVEGWVTEISGHSERMRVSINVHAISDILPENLPETVRLSQRPDAALMPGRFVRCFASLQPPPSPMLAGDYDFERNAFFDGLGAVGFVFGQCEPGRLSQADSSVNGFALWLNAERRQLAAHIASMSGDGAGLAAALLTGNRSYLSEEDEETLRASGLAHLLAISGLHMGLAAGVFYFGIFRMLALFPAIALRIPLQKVAGIGSLVAITAYLLFSGASVATQRAYIMVMSVLVYSLFDRPLLSFQALAIAMMSVLLLAPWSVLTPGFQMSFAATGALLAGYRNFDKQKTARQGALHKSVLPFLDGLVRTSWIAGFATMPFALYHFGRAAPLGFFANILIMPIITLLCVPIAAISVVLLPFGLGDMGLEALTHALGWVLDFAVYFTQDWNGWRRFVPGQMPVEVFLAMVGALACWTIVRSNRIAVMIAFSGIAVVMWLMSPKPTMIYDGAGHIFVREQSDWIELDIGGRGLRPLRFADVREHVCTEGCDMLDGSVRIDRTENAIQLTGGDGNSIQIEKSNPRVAHIFETGEEYEIRWSDRYRCRPWSTNYPDCH